MESSICTDWTPFWLTTSVFLFLAGWWCNNMWRFIQDIFRFIKLKLNELTEYRNSIRSARAIVVTEEY